jgi:pilus assembly protein CpaC
MSTFSIGKAIRPLAVAMLAMVLTTTLVSADVRERIRIPMGRSEVVTSLDLVRTVAIAEPKIADAAVGSERTVVVNGKSLGTTTLIVYAEGGRFTAYDVEVYEPNSDKQVALHVRVAEVNSNSAKTVGFDLLGTGVIPTGKGGMLSGATFPSKVSEPHDPLLIGPSTDGFLSYARADLALQTTWKALEDKGELRTLANPTLVARSGEKASFLAGGEFPVPVASSGGVGGVAVTIEWKQFGVKVEFTPTVQDDGSIILEVAPEVSQLNFAQGIEINGFRIPSLTSRKTGTTVRLDPGQHLVIGGLKQSENVKTVRRIPVLGQIPILGFFFSHSSTEKVDRDLLLVVSPEMVNGGTRQLPQLPTDPAGK